jgi:Domain of unknown function (DUF4158)
MRLPTSASPTPYRPREAEAGSASISVIAVPSNSVIVLNQAAGFRLTRWLCVLCWTGDDRPGLLFDRATTWLLAHKVLLPGITTLERLISRVRYRATLRLWHHLTNALTDNQRQKLVALVTSDDDRLNALDDLCATPTRRSPTELLRHLKRIDAIRGHGLSLAPAADLPAAPLGRLARSARTAKPANLAALHEPRRTATLAALFQTLEATALDDATAASRDQSLAQSQW